MLVIVCEGVRDPVPVLLIVTVDVPVNEGVSDGVIGADGVTLAVWVAVCVDVSV